MDSFIKKSLISITKFFRIDICDEMANNLIQFIKFGIVGVTNTVISYLLNIGTLKCLEGYHLSWDYVVANMASFFLSVLWSFYWNNRFVFSKKEGERRSLGLALFKTYISYGFTGIVLTNIMSYIWIVCLGLSKYIAPIINLVVSVPLNFILNKKWAFNS